MGVFCCHGNQTKKQITIILAPLNCPYPSNICKELEPYCLNGFGEVVIRKISFLKLNVAMATKQNSHWSYHHSHLYWVDNHPMIINAKYGSHHFTGTGYGENAI